MGSEVISFRKRVFFVSRRHGRSIYVCAGLVLVLCFTLCPKFFKERNSSDRGIIIYTTGSYRRNEATPKPKSFQEMLKLLRWYNAGDLVWQYAASSLIDPERMILCRTNTADCIDFARKCQTSAVMYRPEANLLAEEGTFENRRKMMAGVTRDILNRDVPVLFVGIGAQGEFSRNQEGRDVNPSDSIELFANDYNLSTEGKRMLRRLDEMKMPLLVRGRFTAAVAGRFGMSRALSCGCPSLLINKNVDMGRGLSVRYERVRNRVNDSTLRVAINIKPKLTRLLDMYLRLSEQYSNSIFFVQESNDIRILREKGVAFHRIHAAMSYVAWKEKLCSMDISIGSRIHGNMAALGCQEAVPVVVIAGDYRVLELSQAMQVPYVTVYDDCFRYEDWFSRALNRIRFDGTLFDRNRCETANKYIRVFETFRVEPSRKLRRIADSCVYN